MCHQNHYRDELYSVFFLNNPASFVRTSHLSNRCSFYEIKLPLRVYSFLFSVDSRKLTFRGRFRRPFDSFSAVCRKEKTAQEIVVLWRLISGEFGHSELIKLVFYQL